MDETTLASRALSAVKMQVAWPFLPFLKTQDVHSRQLKMKLYKSLYPAPRKNQYRIKGIRPPPRGNNACAPGPSAFQRVKIKWALV